MALTFHFRSQLELEGTFSFDANNSCPVFKCIAPIFAGNGWGKAAACGMIVVLGSLAQLASVATNIVVDKDWIVILSDEDQNQLASNVSLISDVE